MYLLTSELKFNKESYVQKKCSHQAALANEASIIVFVFIGFLVKIWYKFLKLRSDTIFLFSFNLEHLI